MVRGVDIGCHIYTAQDEFSGAFDGALEPTMAVILAHDLIDFERDADNQNINNLYLRMPDTDQLWYIVELCLTHCCAVAGEQWQRVVAGFVVGTCLYARGGRESQGSHSRVSIVRKLRPSKKWTYAPGLLEYFESGRCACAALEHEVDVHRELSEIHVSSAEVVRGWLGNRWKTHFDMSRLQPLALACLSVIRSKAASSPAETRPEQYSDLTQLSLARERLRVFITKPKVK